MSDKTEWGKLRDFDIGAIVQVAGQRLREFKITEKFRGPERNRMVKLQDTRNGWTLSCKGDQSCRLIREAE